MFKQLIISFLRRCISALEYEERQKREMRLKKLTMDGSMPFIEEGLALSGDEYIKIGGFFHAGRMFRIEAFDSYGVQKFTPSICIGDHVHILNYCHVGCIEKVEIGDGTIIGSKVLIIDHSHGAVDASESEIRPLERPLVSKPIKIGKNCWLGDGVCIMPGVTIGDNVVVGANAVVTHSFESNVVIAGIPAKIIRKI